MDRILAYVDENMLVEDFLNSEKNTMTAIGMALQMILGTGTWVDGLNCTPTSPASLQVLVAQGSIVTFGNIDGTAYGDLGSDTAHQIVKQGIVIGNTTFTIAVPVTSGQSQKYLIQAEFQEVDTGSTVLPYYNSSNPSVAWNGPSNSGTSQNTLRKGECVLSLKAGTAATTGTEVAPTPDAGFTGLWVIDVANGATTVVSGNITRYPGAPFIDQKLNDKGTGTGTARTTLTGNATYYVSTSGSDSAAGTSGAPWQTLQHAANVILQTVDSAGFNVTIQAANNTFTAGVAFNAPLIGGGTLTLQGDTSTTYPSAPLAIISATSQDCVSATNGAVVNVSGFTLQTTTQGNGLNALKDGQIIVSGNMRFGSMGGQGADMTANNLGRIEVDVSFSTTGTKVSTFDVHADASLNVGSSVAVTLVASPTYTAFASATKVSFMELAGITYSGAATSGLQYIVTGNSLIDTNANTTNWPTGLASNTTNTGGQIS